MALNNHMSAVKQRIIAVREKLSKEAPKWNAHTTGNNCFALIHKNMTPEALLAATDQIGHVVDGAAKSVTQKAEELLQRHHVLHDDMHAEMANVDCEAGTASLDTVERLVGILEDQVKVAQEAHNMATKGNTKESCECHNAVSHTSPASKTARLKWVAPQTLLSRMRKSTDNRDPAAVFSIPYKVNEEGKVALLPSGPRRKLSQATVRRLSAVKAHTAIPRKVVAAARPSLVVL